MFQQVSYACTCNLVFFSCSNIGQIEEYEVVLLQENDESYTVKENWCWDRWDFQEQMVILCNTWNTFLRTQSMPSKSTNNIVSISRSCSTANKLVQLYWNRPHNSFLMSVALIDGILLPCKGNHILIYFPLSLFTVRKHFRLLDLQNENVQQGNAHLHILFVKNWSTDAASTTVTTFSCSITNVCFFFNIPKSVC